MKPKNLVVDGLPIQQIQAERRWQAGTLCYSTGGLAVLFGWLLWGDFAFQMRDRTVPNVIQILFKDFGASDTLTAILVSSLPAALGMVLGPIVGCQSDRLRSRWGRRIPFLIVPVPFVVLSMAGLAFSPQIGYYLNVLLGLHAPGLNFSILIVMGLFWTIFELSCLTANSLFGALVNDVVPQIIVGRFLGLFRAVSLIAGILISFYVMGMAEAYFTWIFLGIAVIYCAGFSIMCLKVKEGEYPPPPPKSSGSFGPLSGAITYFKESFGEPYYLWFFAATTLGNLAVGPFNLYAIFYAKSLGMGMGDYGKCLTVTYVISLCLIYPLAALADRYHPLRLSIGMLSLYMLVMFWAVFYVRDSQTFSIALVAHGVITGAFLTASASLPQRLLPQAKFAEINSAGGIIGSLAWMTLGPVVGNVMDRVHHDYHYIFYIGFAIAGVALIVNGVLQSKFMALGGPANYRAPE